MLEDIPWALYDIEVDWVDTNKPSIYHSTCHESSGWVLDMEEAIEWVKRHEEDCTG